MASILSLLKAFGKQPGCERYTADGERVKLLSTYLWLRQLTDGLTFERFLERFAPLADFDESNRKHPDDAIAFHCPRRKATADELKKPQWTAAEVVDFSALYVDMIREAETAGVEVPMNFEEFCEAMTGPFKAGELDAPEETPVAAPAASPAAPVTAMAVAPAATPETAATPPATKTRRKTAAPAAATGVAPTLTVQGRAIYNVNGTERQVRGIVLGLHTEPSTQRQYVDFKGDSGEVFSGCNILHFTAVTEVEHPLPPPVAVVERQKLWVPKAQAPSVQAALALNVAMGNVAVGEVIYPFVQPFGNGLAVMVAVVNGDTGPFVDAQLYKQENDEVIADVAPRKNLVGEYQFTTDAGVYVLEVALRE